MGSFAYFPHTGEDIRSMLDRCGVNSIDDLYSDVPADFIYKDEYDLGPAMSEQEVRDYFESLASRNARLTVFAGAGAYDHYTPAVIPAITSRSEFLTAYTPYQCEISQGTLRYIFEFQSMVCALTGLDVANASMYDGATAAAESVRLCVASSRGKDCVLVSSTLLPSVLAVVRTYAKWGGVKLVEVPEKDGQTDIAAIAGLMDTNAVAGALLPQVNRYGILENHDGAADTLHARGALLVEYCDPSVLAVVKTPAEWGADVACGDGQSLGIPLCYGGPYVGFMACRTEYMRKMPGRIVGQTLDSEGRRCYVLTLQAREQHIRREKATSNICSNESLMALWVTVYLSLMGPVGMKRVNDLCFERSHYLKRELLSTGLFEDPFPNAGFIKEFALRPLVPADLLQQKLLDCGFFGALSTENGLVTFAATEKRTTEQIDTLVASVKSLKV